MIGPFQCQECGKRMSQARAELIVFGSGRCDCGGVDVDLAPPAVLWPHPRGGAADRPEGRREGAA